MSKFSTLVLDAMDAQGKSIRDIANDTGMTYEHTRRIVSGFSLPTDNMVRWLAKILHLDHQELSDIAHEEILRVKHKGAIERLTKFPKRLQPFVDLEGDLSDKDINELLGLADMKAKANRHSRSARKHA